MSPDGHTSLMQIVEGKITCKVEGKITCKEVEALAAAKGNEPLGVMLTRSGSVSTSAVAEALRMQKRLATVEVAVESSVRVRTDRLDCLIDMIGELVIAHSMVAQEELIADGSHHGAQKKSRLCGKNCTGIAGTEYVSGSWAPPFWGTDVSGSFSIPQVWQASQGMCRGVTADRTWSNFLPCRHGDQPLISGQQGGRYCRPRSR